MICAALFLLLIVLLASVIVGATMFLGAIEKGKFVRLRAFMDKYGGGHGI